MDASGSPWASVSPCLCLEEGLLPVDVRVVCKNHKLCSATPEMPLFFFHGSIACFLNVSPPVCRGAMCRGRLRGWDGGRGERWDREAPQGTKREDWGREEAVTPAARGLGGGAPSVNRRVSSQGPRDAQIPKPSVLGLQKASA